MPMFDFRCDQCAHDFEAFVRASTTPECPQCRSATVSRRLSTFGVGVSSSGSAPAGGNYLGRARTQGTGFGCGAGCACH